MSLIGTGLMAVAFGLSAMGVEKHLSAGLKKKAAVSGLAATFFAVATVWQASQVNEIEDQFAPYETLIEQGAFDAENAVSVCDRMQTEIQKGYEELGGDGKFVISCDLESYTSSLKKEPTP